MDIDKLKVRLKDLKKQQEAAKAIYTQAGNDIVATGGAIQEILSLIKQTEDDAAKEANDGN